MNFSPKQITVRFILAAGAALTMTAWGAVPTPQARITTPINDAERVVLPG